MRGRLVATELHVLGNDDRYLESAVNGLSLADQPSAMLLRLVKEYLDGLAADRLPVVSHKSATDYWRSAFASSPADLGYLDDRC